MQLTLAILEVPSLPAMPRDRLDAEDRAKALEILARILVQALETSRQKEPVDE
ncbi:MAG TPA: hypothetical protein VMA54_09370 [Steroidobacteraceae bacterium]|nr:hypothetical protein [Steroidobacteraceae bacterium]